MLLARILVEEDKQADALAALMKARAAQSTVLL